MKCVAQDGLASMDSASGQADALIKGSLERAGAIKVQAQAQAEDALDCVNSPFMTVPFNRSSNDQTSIVVYYDIDHRCPARQFITVEKADSKATLEKYLADKDFPKLSATLGLSESVARTLIDGYIDDKRSPKTVVETIDESFAARRAFTRENPSLYEPSFNDWAGDVIKMIVKYKVVVILFKPLDRETQRSPSSRPRLRVLPRRATAAGDKA